MTKIELKKRVKSIQHDIENSKQLSDDDKKLLEKLFKFFIGNFTHSRNFVVMLSYLSKEQLNQLKEYLK